MCCFAQPVVEVKNTAIFARLTTDGRQFLLYSMHCKLRKENAMVLPLPVDTASPDFQFLDMSETPELFTEIERSFVPPRPRSSDGWLGGDEFFDDHLEVVNVGSFEASWVPSQDQFERLDPRFRISPRVWAELPHYSDYGFAVFKFRRGEQKVHPMGLCFRTRHPDKLFYPTLHIHDGEIHPQEMFDHVLYAQTETNLIHQPDPDCLPDPHSIYNIDHNWTHSYHPFGQFLSKGNTHNAIHRERKGYRRSIVGRRTNCDVLVPASPLAEPSAGQDTTGHGFSEWIDSSGLFGD